jgi:hypothetical protein
MYIDSSFQLKIIKHCEYIFSYVKGIIVFLLYFIYQAATTYFDNNLAKCKKYFILLSFGFTTI